MPLAERYKREVISFMRFRDGIEYNRNHEFTPQALGNVTPVEIVRWMCLKVYGNPDPGVDDNPTEGRSSLLEFYKKALS